MTLRQLSFTDPQLSKRLQLGLFCGVIGGLGATLLDVVRAVTGPRYQTVRGTEYDLWLEIAAVMAAVLVGSLAGAALGPLWRRRSVAALLGAACVLPLVVAESIAAHPHGPARYHVDWLSTLIVVVAVAGIVAWKHPQYARDFEDARLLSRARRIGKAQRGSL